MILKALKDRWFKDILFDLSKMVQTKAELERQIGQLNTEIVRLKNANQNAWGMYYALKDGLEARGFVYSEHTMSFHNPEKDLLINV